MSKATIHVESLVINITNICNMDCEFCLRGGSRQGKLDLALIPKIFKGISKVDTLTLTGGEPSMYPEAVTAITDYLVYHKDDIQIDGMFIATNGKVYCQELVDAVKTMMYLYMERKFGDGSYMDYSSRRFIKSMYEDMRYLFSIAVSVDAYHEPIDQTNYIKYLTSGVYSEAKEWDFSNGGVLSRGRGAFISGSIYRAYQEFKAVCEDDEIMAESIYITSDGEVFADCDMSQDMEEDCEPAGLLETETLAEIIERAAVSE